MEKSSAASEEIILAGGFFRAAVNPFAGKFEALSISIASVSNHCRSYLFAVDRQITTFAG